MWHKIYFEENIAICRCTSWIRTQFGGCDGDGKTVFADYCVHHYNIIGDFLYFASHNEHSGKNLYTGWGGIFDFGGSAIAATAPVIDADEEEVAQAISVIFLFNILAALIFPVLGTALGFSTTSGEAFGIFAGTAVNDTSSVTAAASTWDSMYHLGSQTLDKAVTVKLTRTLAIIPITLVLALRRARKAETESGEKVSLKKVFPFFILFFIGASLITTAATAAGVPTEVFQPLKELSKFFIIMAMGAIGFHTDVVKLIKGGGKPILMGMACWLGITVVTLSMQHLLNLW